MRYERTIQLPGLACITFIVLLVSGCSRTNNENDSDRNSFTQSSSSVINTRVLNSPIQPIPEAPDINQNKIILGEMLFNERRLSLDDTISCASCHNLQKGGVDNLSISVGIHGKTGSINAPTVFNSGLNIAQFWDGRVESLVDQVDGPIHNQNEMGSNWQQIIAKLNSDKKYRSHFQDVYSTGITSTNIKDAISAFEETLLTTNSPFDRYLLGDQNAISEKARTGYEKFKEYGCVACHQGSNVGGNIYQPLGIMGDYFGDRGTEITKEDLGRFNVTGLEEDKHVFRVPSLRLAALTAPYFHDGSASTLEDAVRVMIKYQLGRPVPQQDEEMIIEFLHSLVGEYKGEKLLQ